MKKLGLVMLFAVCFAFASNVQAQDRTDNYPYWTISKSVQHIPYKNVKLLPAKISTADLALTSSKGVQQVKADSNQKNGRVTMSGYPAWAISKGVARMQYEKN